MTGIDHDAFLAGLPADLTETFAAFGGELTALLTESRLDFGDPGGHERVVLDALTAAATAPARVHPGNLSLSGVTVVPGSLVVRGHLEFDAHVFVLGDLHVDGVVRNLAPHSVLAVGGTLRAGHLLAFRAYVHVTTIDVAGIAAFCTYGGVFGVNSLLARVLWTEDAYFADAQGDELDEPPMDVVLHVDDTATPEQLQPFLEGDLPLTDDDAVDLLGLFDALVAGDTKLR